ncbi:sensor histidine kinase, partial [Streptomyces sp. NPDC101219]|uniref:sensor histidine kinase n=1 Tax=Streptomyces sp. NPDC101219 TaxID=3366131 RepID=UPI0038018AEC
MSTAGDPRDPAGPGTGPVPAVRGHGSRGVRARTGEPGRPAASPPGGPATRRAGSRATASDPRGPGSRGDRREGGRHGRPSARTAAALAETHIRPQLLRLAVLPPVAVALSGCAAVLFTVRSSGVRPGPTMWAVLGGAVSVTLAGIVIAAVAADRAARLVHDRLTTLRRSTARREADLRTLVDDLRRGDGPPARSHPAEPPAGADDFDLLAADLTRAHDGAVTAVVQASRLSSQAGSEQKLEVFVNLARRLQSLVHREISILDELENEIEDPDLLKGLFHVDHLATRIRRHAENLAVLGGAVSRRQWSNPVSMTEVLRSAIAEVEQYSRVKLVPPIDGTLRGHAVADVIHLLAELVENATVFSAPHTQVLLRASLVTSGLAVEVEDRGLGMPVGEQERMNALLADPDQVNVASLLADGRIGLFVVSQLAKRHGIQVRLQTNIYGGVQAVLVVPQALLGSEPGTAASAAPGGGPAGGAVTAGAAPGGAVTAGAAPAGPALAPVPPSAAAARPHPQGSAPTAVPDTGVPAVAPPLPARHARESRATPAEAVPGITAEDRLVLEENGLQPLTPRGGSPVRGTMDKPRLPRRRAQEHIVPQLKDGPAPRQDTGDVAGHDPDLMAAFQRGISLAEAQQQLDPGPDAPGTTGIPGAAEAAPDAAPPLPDRTATGHGAPAPTAVGHTAVGQTAVGQTAVGQTAVGHTAPEPTAADRTAPGLPAPRHADGSLPSPGHTEARPVDGSLPSPGRTEARHADGSHQPSDHTGARHADGSHPAPGHTETRTAETRS